MKMIVEFQRLFRTGILSPILVQTPGYQGCQKNRKDLMICLAASFQPKLKAFKINKIVEI